MNAVAIAASPWLVVLVAIGGGDSRTAQNVAEGIREAGTHRIEGRVVDDQTGDPVPFVNVGVPGAALGTVGDEDGTFALAGIRSGAAIAFSAIGYETRSVDLPAFPSHGEITLTPVEIGFREAVSVTAEATGNPAVFGHRLKERGFGFGFGSGLLGAEIGARIRIDGPTFLESANFTVAHTGGERFLYRINLYDFSGKVIGENLLETNVIVAAKQERGTLTVDLREQGLIVRNDVLLSLEWIQDDRDIGNANVMFRARPRGKANLYHKLTSQMPFRKVPRLGLGFYLVGYQLP